MAGTFRSSGKSEDGLYQTEQYLLRPCLLRCVHPDHKGWADRFANFMRECVAAIIACSAGFPPSRE